MNKITLGLLALLMVAMVVIMAPNILALNRGKILRNIAVWLAVVAVLALIYQNFGPGKSSSWSRLFPASQGDTPPPSGSDQNNGDQGFTPPKD